jgi:phosphotransferase system IIB component
MKDSLYGNCVTNLIVHINEDNNMINESISTLRFGSNCCYLKNNITKEIVNKEEEVLNVKSEILEYKNKLKIMKQNELSGGFNCDITLKETFISNFNKLK